MKGNLTARTTKRRRSDLKDEEGFVGCCKRPRQDSPNGNNKSNRSNPSEISPLQQPLEMGALSNGGHLINDPFTLLGSRPGVCPGQCPCFVMCL